MLFNSIEFAVFLPIVFIVYWIIGRDRVLYQNLFLLAASYVFYGWWDWKFLALIAFSSLVDYGVGLKLGKEQNSRRRTFLLTISLVVNLGFLGFFKYFNFFVESFAEAFTLFGQNIDPSRLDIVLPVGISFYTFQTLSYSIDVYRRRLKPTRDPVQFFSFVSFFPQLVAGPIERATNLLPQFHKKRSFEYVQASDGLRQILWGLFKKMVIADNCAVIVNQIFANYDVQPGGVLFLGAVLFAFQIYGDFSGYSDIAIGTARLFGFELKRNFAFPYFSRDIAEFWRRWHISLSTWFRDYLYIPLGGSRGGTWLRVRNTFIIFVVSGLWHGANWTFVVWGALNALYFLPLLLSGKNRMNLDEISEGRLFPSVKELLGIALTFFLTCVAWIFFRAETVSIALDYSMSMFAGITDSPGVIMHFIKKELILFLLILLAVEWLQRSKQHGLDFHGRKVPTVVRWGTYYLLVIIILTFGGQPQEFIYFQF